MVANFQEQTTSFQMDSPQIIDRLVAMRRQEDTYKCSDYLSCVESLVGDKATSLKLVNADCRTKTLQWCSQVAEFCKFDNETVCIAMSNMDRFLSTEQGKVYILDRKDFQLVAICAFYTAVKLSEAKELDISLLSEISKGSYSTESIARMEWEMLSALNWRMHPPTAFSFIHHLLAFLPSSALAPSLKDGFIRHARHQADLAVMDYGLVTCNPSTIGVASILNTLEGLDECYFSGPARDAFVKNLSNVLKIDINSRDVREVRERLQSTLIARSEKSKRCESPTKQSRSSKRPRSPVSVCRKL